MSNEYSLPKSYEPGNIEEPVYDIWLESGSFHATPDARPPEQRYVIMMPLPNVTGALHMGHALDNVMQDLLIRWHRMMGDNTLWMPGTDHAGIATQAVVEKRLKELEGLTRHDVGREGLVERIFAWKDQYQARIIRQQQRMGCSCDWERQRFTMDAVCSRAVRHTFFNLFRDGLIVRGKRLVNWDTFLQTSVSDDEVYHETVQGHFWHLRYPVMDRQDGEPEWVEVATTRPETMLGDTAVAVHPDPEGAIDREIAELRERLATVPKREQGAIEARITELEERKQTHLPLLVQLRDMARAGRQVMLPLMDRPIPLILDEWAKPGLGTGCVKITPAHDQNDYDVWTRHKDEIDIINVLAPDGTINANAPRYTGLDRYAARDKVVEDLRELELLGAIDDREIEIGHSDRSKTPVEPYLSDQWFVRMGDVEGGIVMGRGTPREFRAAGLVQAAIDAAEDGRVKFHPERFLKPYVDWLAEKRDWPVSRQLWWGHRIPVWSQTTTVGELAKLFAREEMAWLTARAETAVCRVVLPEQGRSALYAGSLDELGAGADEPCKVDVCLVADDEEAEARLAALGLERDPDVLDTWFSSALWPHSTLGWPAPASANVEGGAPLGAEGDGDDCLDYYYPGSCLVTARDIITLWVARMVLSGLYNLGDIPFSDVFIHANILDGKGERMSKSKGNGIDPVDIIGTYGADAMRYVLCDMQTGNQDIRLPVTAVCPRCEHHNDLGATKHGRNVFTYLCAGCKEEFDVLGTMPDVPAATLISERFFDGRKFCNKLWNTFRFALHYLEDVPKTPVSLDDLAIEDRWILAALNEAVRAVHQGLADYNPSAALGAARDFMWGSLCDWYLELIKPRLNNPGDASAGTARQVLAYALDQTLRLLHPFVPFISEFLYQKLRDQVPDRSLPGLGTLSDEAALIAAGWPAPVDTLDAPDLVALFGDLQTITSSVREVRSTQRISPNRKLDVTLKPPAARADTLRSQAHVIAHLAGVGELVVDPTAGRPAGAASVLSGDIQLFVHDVIDDTEERARIQKEIARVDKEIATHRKRLDNAGFVSRAPAEVVEENRTRLAGYEEQRQALESALAELGGEA